MFRTVAVAATLALASATTFTKCATDNLGIRTVSVNPDPVVSGQNLNVAIDGITAVAVADGSATVKIKVYGVTVETLSFDTCKDLGVACPVAVGGEFKAGLTYPIPSSTPAGLTADVQVSLADGKGSPLSCIEVKVGTSKSALRSAKTSQADIEFLFEAWRREHAMEFESAQEYVDRLAIFAANHVRIAEHNTSGASFQMAHNKFSHLTADEFKAQLNGYVQMEKDGTSVPFDLTNTASAIDWTTKGAVTPVKDQGQCGSCWSFSTTGSVEGAYFLKTGKLLSFSEQELVDCDTGDAGCNGGLMDTAFGYVEKKGLASEGDYTYTAADGTCSSSKFSRAIPAGFITGYTDVPAGSESALLAAVTSRPVSVAIEADQTAFQFYSSGVLTGTCGHNLDHGVLAVGYGTDNGVDYWKVKNSWGSSWGEQGFIRMKRNVGMCGIADAASYPTTA